MCDWNKQSNQYMKYDLNIKICLSEGGKLKTGKNIGCKTF